MSSFRNVYAMEFNLLGSKVCLITQFLHSGRSVQVGNCVQLFLHAPLILAQSNFKMIYADQK